MHVSVYPYMHARDSAYTFIHMYIWLHVDMYVYMSVWIYIIYTSVHVYTYMIVNGDHGSDKF